MKTKTIAIAFAVLVVIIVAQFFYFKMIKADLELENLNLIEEKKTELKQVRDSAFLKIQDLTEKSQITFDSILQISQEIKYIPYEKLIYADRNLDDALDIISNYRYNEGTESPD